MRVKQADGIPGYVIHGGEYGRSRGGTLIQQDWDYPGVAEALGWSTTRVQKRHGRTVHLSRIPKDSRIMNQGYYGIRYPGACRHSGTDGTVDCRDCGITAGEFIRAAGEYLDRRAG